VGLFADVCECRCGQHWSRNRGVGPNPDPGVQAHWVAQFRKLVQRADRRRRRLPAPGAQRGCLYLSGAAQEQSLGRPSWRLRVQARRSQRRPGEHGLTRRGHQPSLAGAGGAPPRPHVSGVGCSARGPGHGHPQFRYLAELLRRRSSHHRQDRRDRRGARANRRRDAEGVLRISGFRGVAPAADAAFGAATGLHDDLVAVHRVA